MDEGIKYSLSQHLGENRKRLRNSEASKADIREKINASRDEGGWRKLEEVLPQDEACDSVGIRRILQALLFEGVGPKTRAKHLFEVEATPFEYMRGGRRVVRRS